MMGIPWLEIREEDLCASFDIVSGTLKNRPRIERRLSDLRGIFCDPAAYEAALAKDDPVIYAVTSIEPAQGCGQLHYGLGILYPGKIGAEYYLTKGHFHAQRSAAEIYIGLSGSGLMLLEDESGTESRTIPLSRHSVVYVPGYTAHRTVNTGPEPLIYLGVYPAEAGHDYGPVAARNFRMTVVERNGLPVLESR